MSKFMKTQQSILSYSDDLPDALTIDKFDAEIREQCTFLGDGVLGLEADLSIDVIIDFLNNSSLEVNYEAQVIFNRKSHDIVDVRVYEVDYSTNECHYFMQPNESFEYICYNRGIDNKATASKVGQLLKSIISKSATISVNEINSAIIEQ